VNGMIVGSIPTAAATFTRSRMAKLVRRNALNVVSPGSNPGPRKLCPSSSSLRLLVVIQVTRARISLGTPIAGVTQLAEVTVLKTVCSEFDSQRQQNARLGKLANPTALEAVVSEFESQAGHQRACRLTANHPAFNRKLGVRLAPRAPIWSRRLAVR